MSSEAGDTGESWPRHGERAWEGCRRPEDSNALTHSPAQQERGGKSGVTARGSRRVAKETGIQARLHGEGLRVGKLCLKMVGLR